MENLGLALLAAAFGTGALMLGAKTRRDGAARARQRSCYFDDCAALLTTPRIGRGTAGFPRLGGAFDGIAADVQAMPDTLTFRKLPALWVMVTLLAPLPLRATLNVMIRPTGIEPFSKFNTLPDQITPPLGFPDDCVIRTDASDALLPELVLRPFVTVFDDQAVKEVVIAPKGLRITFLAEEAHRGSYLIFRNAEMGKTRLHPSRVAPVLARLAGLCSHFIAAPPAAEERIPA